MPFLPLIWGLSSPLSGAFPASYLVLFGPLSGAYLAPIRALIYALSGPLFSPYPGPYLAPIRALLKAPVNTPSHLYLLCTGFMVQSGWEIVCDYYQHVDR